MIKMIVGGHLEVVYEVSARKTEILYFRFFKFMQESILSGNDLNLSTKKRLLIYEPELLFEYSCHGTGHGGNSAGRDPDQRGGPGAFRLFGHAVKAVGNE